MKIDWDRYVDEDEEEEGFDKSAVSFFLYLIWLYNMMMYMLNISPYRFIFFKPHFFKYSLTEVWIWEAWEECLEVRQRTNKVNSILRIRGTLFSK